MHLVRTCWKLARPIKRITRAAAAQIVRRLIAQPTARNYLNRAYNILTARQREMVHAHFSGSWHLPQPGIWHLRFEGRDINCPIRSSLDFGLALAVLGHDPPVKETYRHLIRSTPPDLFIDIGANYGTHSIIFLACGVATISFEPNTLCQPYFKELCLANGCVPDIEAVALGASTAPLTLSFPAGAEWLGSTNREFTRKLIELYPVISSVVPQRRLDDYLPKLSQYKKVLIKIDTEGSEADVLRGAQTVIDTIRPTLIFECLPEARPEMFSVLQNMNYKIERLPMRGKRAPAISAQEFYKMAAINFAATPR